MFNCFQINGDSTAYLGSLQQLRNKFMFVIKAFYHFKWFCNYLYISQQHNRSCHMLDSYSPWSPMTAFNFTWVSIQSDPNPDTAHLIKPQDLNHMEPKIILPFYFKLVLHFFFFFNYSKQFLILNAGILFFQCKLSFGSI